MIKVWPIHKHKWEHENNVQCGCNNHNLSISGERATFGSVAISCYCGQFKVTKLPQGACWSSKDIKRIMEVKGWKYD